MCCVNDIFIFNKQRSLSRVLHSLFQALGQWGLSNAAGRRATCDERGLVEKEGRSVEPVSIVLKTSFRYTISRYTL